MDTRQVKPIEMLASSFRPYIFISHIPRDLVRLRTYYMALGSYILPIGRIMRAEVPFVAQLVMIFLRSRRVTFKCC